MPFLFFFAVLLAVLIAYIVGLGPVKTPKKSADDFATHLSLLQYIEAKKLIVPLLPAPVAWWSPPRACGEAGNGIWLAQGVVALQSPTNEEIQSRWTAIFIPGNPKPLYLRLGPQEVGNLALALRQAGFHSGKH